MALRPEETITCEDGAGRKYEVEIWQEYGQSASMDGHHRLIGLRQAFRVGGEDTILRRAGDR